MLEAGSIRQLRSAVPAVPSVALVLLVSGVLGGCRDRREAPPRSAAPLAVPAVALEPAHEDAAVCGNGIVDEGEQCDHGIPQRGRCPDGWGVCRTCVPDCRLVLARHEDLVYGAHTNPGWYITDGSIGLAVRVDEYRIAEGKRVLSGSTATDFDERGRWTRLASDTDADGTFEKATVLVYDAQGRRVQQWAEGDPKQLGDRWTRTYDSQGRMISFSPLIAGRESPLWTYEYDDRSNLLREIAVLPDGRKNITTFEYLDGQLWKRRARHSGEERTSDPDQVFTYTATGLPDSQTLVSNGRAVARYTWTYEDGRLVSREEDLDLDGKPEVRQTFAYDASGLARSTDLFSGTRSTATYSRDEQGRISVIRRDTDSDGVVDVESVLHYDDALHRQWMLKAPRREGVKEQNARGDAASR